MPEEVKRTGAISEDTWKAFSTEANKQFLQQEKDYEAGDGLMLQCGSTVALLIIVVLLRFGYLELSTTIGQVITVAAVVGFSALLLYAACAGERNSRRVEEVSDKVFAEVANRCNTTSPGQMTMVRTLERAAGYRNIWRKQAVYTLHVTTGRAGAGAAGPSGGTPLLAQAPGSAEMAKV